MNDQQKEIIPENIIIIKDEYYYCTNDIIYKGNKSEIYKGREKSNFIISSTNSYDTSFSICIKKEPPFIKYPELQKEYNILKYLQKFIPGGEMGDPFHPTTTYIPKIYNYFHNDNSPSYLIEKLYGNSLDSIFKMCKKNFSLKCTIILIQQMLRIIQSLHDKGIIHRNLNPRKFLFDKEKTSDRLLSKMIQKEIIIDPKSQLYLIDYSSAKYYIEDESHLNNNKHIEFNDAVKDFTFTNKNFCSIWAELKTEQSRRDDLFSLFYIMIYLFTGSLPWIGIKSKSKKEKREKIRNLKLCLSNFELCQNVNNIISNEVELFAFYLNGLSFEDEPNYYYLEQLLKEMIDKVDNSKNYKLTEPVIKIKN